LAAARLARERRILVSFDPNLRLELWDDPDSARQWILAALPLADLVKVSGDEVAFLTGTDDPRRAAGILRSAGPKLAVVTLGQEGSYVQLEAFDELVPTFDVTAVDATGAGDAFVSGLLARLLGRGVDDLESSGRAEVSEAVRFANAAGALATTQVGAIPSLPTLEAVRTLMDGAASDAVV
jgi:fructokinase